MNNVLSSDTASHSRPSLEPAEAYDRVEKFLSRDAPRNRKPIGLGDPATFTARYKKDANLRRVVDNLDNVERRIEGAMEPIDRFKNMVQQLFSGGKTIAPSSNGLRIELEDGNKLTPAQLSSGEKHLLRILLAAMTGGGSSILIDEPELSMHIDWQRVFVKTVRALNPDCQLILASHSPEIMADLTDNQIFRI